MADQEKDKQLDDLLESLLSNYTVAEPRPGLETRILAQVRDAASKRRSWFWNLGWLGAGAAAITALVLFLYFSRPNTQPYRAPLETVKSPVQPQYVEHPHPLVQSRPRQEGPGSEPAIKASDRHSQSPQAVQEKDNTLAVQDRPAIFPTPVPLSEQEKLFFRYLASTPRDEVIAQSHSDEVVDGLPDDKSAMPGTVRQSITNGTR